MSEQPPTVAQPRLWQEEFPRRWKSILAAWDRLQHVEWSFETFTQLHTSVRQLNGLCVSLGLVEISSAIKPVEEMLSLLESSRQVPSAKQRQKLSEAFAQALVEAPQLRSSADDASVSQPATVDAPHLMDGPEGDAKLIYLADSDNISAEILSARLERYGYRVRRFTRLETLREAIMRKQPALIISEVVFPSGEMAGIEMMAKILKGMRESVPVLFISSRADLKARISALRIGGSGFLMKPIDTTRLIVRIDELTQAVSAEPMRVLIVDDEPTVAMMHGRILESAGMRVTLVSRPLDVMGPLLELQPDALLVDYHMPEYDGLELAALIRQEEQFRQLPIFFITSDYDPALPTRSLASGADEFIQKPVEPARLIELVTNRVNRSRGVQRELRLLQQRDGTTGLYNRKTFLEKLLWLQNRGDKVGGMLLIGIDNLGDLQCHLGFEKSEHLMAELGQLFGEQLKKREIIARFGDGEFSFWIERDSIEGLTEAAHSLLNATENFKSLLGSVRVSASAGLSLASDKPVADLVQESIEARTQAYRLGGRRLQLHQDVLFREQAEAWATRYADKLDMRDLGQHLRLFFQPLAQLSGEPTERYETLLRLVDFEGELIPIGDFLALARRKGLMARVDRWVLEHALRQYSKSGASRRRVTLYVKLSAESLAQEGLLQEIAEVMKRHPGGREHMVFSLALADMLHLGERAKTVVVGIRALQCRICLEHVDYHPDSLKLVELLKPEFIKLSRNLVERIQEEEVGIERVRQVAACSHANNGEVIAGFVEQASTMGALWNSGVDLLQGYFVQQPVAELKFDFGMQHM